MYHFQVEVVSRESFCHLQTQFAVSDYTCVHDCIQGMVPRLLSCVSHVMLCPSCHAVSVMSCCAHHVMLCPSCHAVSVMSCCVYHVMLCPSCHAVSIMSCCVCHVMPCPSCHAASVMWGCVHYAIPCCLELLSLVLSVYHIHL